MLNVIKKGLPHGFKLSKNWIAREHGKSKEVITEK